MAFRYKLRSLTPQDDPQALLQEIYPPGNSFGEVLSEESKALQWVAVISLLKHLGASRLLIQHGIRDPDFLEEHQAFYAKQHRPVTRKCIRIHAFVIDVPIPVESNEAAVLEFLAAAKAKADSYVGFITVRPLRHAPVGATIISPPVSRQPTAYDEFPVHIAGIEFKVTGTPFLQQDNAVGACAQASIWMALRTLRRRQGNVAYSPAELTVAATRYISSDRTFPGRIGLTIEQMLEAIRFAGHDPLHLSLRELISAEEKVQAVLQRAVPYVESGLPVIMGLKHNSGGHAVVAIGVQNSSKQLSNETVTHTQDAGKTKIVYTPSSAWTAALVIHNDNSGPYLKLGSDQDANYRLDHAISLIVPLPDGIYTTAGEAEVLAMRALVRLSAIFSVGTIGTPLMPEEPIVLRTILCTRHRFREWAKDDSTLAPQVSARYRTHELPEQMWVIEIHAKSIFNPGDPSVASRAGEIVLDAAADSVHADALIFARVTSKLWPSAKASTTLLLWEDEVGVGAIGTAGSDFGRPLLKPW